MVHHGPAIRNIAEANEIHLRARFHAEIPYYVGPRDDECTGCSALHWLAERPKGTSKSARYMYLECCHKGAITLPVHYFGSPAVPRFLQHLLTADDNG